MHQRTFENGLLKGYTFTLPCLYAEVVSHCLRSTPAHGEAQITGKSEKEVLRMISPEALRLNEILRNAPKAVDMDLAHQRQAGEHAEDMTSEP